MLHVCMSTSTHIHIYTYIYIYIYIHIYIYIYTYIYMYNIILYTYPRGRWHIEVHLRRGDVKLWVIGIQEGWVCVVSVLDLGVWKYVSLYTLKPWPYTCIHNIILHVCTIFFPTVAMTIGEILLFCMYVHAYATYMYWNWSLLKALSNLPSIETQDCSSFVKIADPTSALLPTNITETYRSIKINPKIE